VRNPGQTPLELEFGYVVEEKAVSCVVRIQVLETLD